MKSDNYIKILRGKSSGCVPSVYAAVDINCVLQLLCCTLSRYIMQVFIFNGTAFLEKYDI